MNALIKSEIYSVQQFFYSQAYFSPEKYPIMIVIVIPLSIFHFHFAIKAYGYSITLPAWQMLN